MANYRAISTGVWSDLARWEDDGSGSYVASTVLPGVSDVVYANGYIVTLDIDITVSQLRNDSTINVVQNGYFIYSAGCDVVIADIYNANITAISCLYHTTADTKYLIGNVYGASGASNNCFGVLVQSITGTFVQTGNVNTNATATSTAGFTGGVGVVSGNYILNGNAFGSPVPGAVASNGILHPGGTNGNTIINGFTQVISTSAAVRINSGTLLVHTRYPNSIASSIPVTIVNDIFTLGNVRYDANGSILTYLTDGTPIIFTAAPNYPSENDVRNGIQYGSGNMFIGNLEAGATPNDIWNYLLTNINTNGSIGKLIKDNIDATISSRSTQTSVDNISVDLTPVLNELNDIENKIDIIDTNIDTVLVDLDNIENKIDIIDTNVDNIPTNPLLTNDIRLNNLDATISTRSTQTSVDNINDKIDIIDTNVDTTLNDLNDIENKIDIIDTNVDTTLNDLNDIEDKIDIIDTNVDTTLNELNDIENKIDNIDVDFTPVMDKIDEIPGEVIDELQTSTEPIAERLRNVSTVDTTGLTISGFNQ